MKYNKRALITKLEADCLVKYAEESTLGIVEIGIFKGGTTEILARRSPDTTPVYGVDDYSGSNALPSELYHNFLSSISNVFLVIGDGATIGTLWHKEIDMLFVDSDHKYEMTKTTVESWEDNLGEGGKMILHDTKRNIQFRTLAGTLSSVNLHIGAGIYAQELKTERTDDWRYLETVDTSMVFERV